MLKWFVSLPLGACSSCIVLWMLLPKKSLQEESPKLFHSLFWENCCCCTSCFYMPPYANEHIFENTCFYQHWFIGTFHWCFLEKLSRKKLEIKEIFDLTLLQQSAAFPQFIVCPPCPLPPFVLGQCCSFLLLPNPVYMTQMSCLTANCIFWGSQSRKEIPNTNWRLAILSLVPVHIRGRRGCT